MNNFYITCDIPTKFYFQDPMSLYAEYIFDLHNIVLILLGFLVTFVASLIFLIIYYLPNIESLPRNRFIKNNAINSTYFSILDLANSVRKLNSGVYLEFIWTLFPCILLFIIAIPSFSLLYFMDEIYFPSMTVKVLGSQWYWSYDVSFPYASDVIPNSKVVYDSYLVDYSDLNLGQYRLLQVDNPLAIPVRKDIRVLVTATDVLHSFAVPSFGIKIDAIPGRLNQVFIYSKREGIAFGQCSELCGINHYAMPIMIYVI